MVQHGETRICIFEAEMKMDASQNLKGKKTEHFMAPFYGWGSTASLLESLEEAVYFLPLSSQKFLVLTLLTSEG